MPFGLMNGPATFQRLMVKVFSRFSFVGVYLHDVVVFSASPEAHVDHLLRVYNIVASTGVVSLRGTIYIFRTPDMHCPTGTAVLSHAARAHLFSGRGAARTIV